MSEKLSNSPKRNQSGNFEFLRRKTCLMRRRDKIKAKCFLIEMIHTIEKVSSSFSLYLSNTCLLSWRHLAKEKMRERLKVQITMKRDIQKEKERNIESTLKKRERVTMHLGRERNKREATRHLIWERKREKASLSNLFIFVSSVSLASFLCLTFSSHFLSLEVDSHLLSSQNHTDSATTFSLSLKVTNFSLTLFVFLFLGFHFLWSWLVPFSLISRPLFISPMDR